MLTTTRREIVNDYDLSQNKQLRSFTPANEGAVSPKRFEDARSAVKTEVRTNANYMSRSEIAQKLYGQNYSETATENIEKIEQDFSDPDLMPSVQTMQITRNGFARPTESARTFSNTRTKSSAASVVSTRSKILIACYAAVVLALVLIITLTTVSIASLFADVNALETKLATQKETVFSIENDIVTAGSAETIFNKAPGIGMTAPTNSAQFELPKTKVAQNIAVSTNWFDSFSDWISSVFGG